MLLSTKYRILKAELIALGVLGLMTPVFLSCVEYFKPNKEEPVIPKSQIERVLEQYDTNKPGTIDRGEELSNFLRDYRKVGE